MHLGRNICKGEKMKNIEESKKEELELDDLLISGSEDEEVRETKSKKMILLVAIGVVLFAIIILVVYLLQDDTKQTTPTNTAINKPLEEAKLPEVSQKETNTDFGQVPIQSQNSSDSDEQFQRIIEQIKAQQKEQSLPNPPKEQVAPTKEVVASSKPEPEAKRVDNNAVTPSAPSTPNVAAQFNQSSNEIAKGFYIQVGSFSKVSPNKELLGTIKDLNFEYSMQKSGEVNRLLIGPFKTKLDAQKQLSLVKEKLNKDAFIKEIK